MKTRTFSSRTGRAMVVACIAIGAVAATVSAASGSSADNRVPPVPPKLEVEAGNVLFLIGHGIGTQNYICLPSGAGFAYSLFTPEATLFTHRAKQVTTHFFSPNPDENGTIRATWPPM